MDSRTAKKVDSYTRKTREKKNRDRNAPTTFERLRRSGESAMRPVLYALLRLVFRNRPLRKKIPIGGLRNVLIIPYGDAIGDMVVATPLWRTLKRANPKVSIGVIASDRNRSLIDRDPDVDTLYTFAGRKDLGHISELLRARRERYDLVLNIHFQHQTDYGIFANLAGPRAVKVTAAHPRRALYEIFFNCIGTRPRHEVHVSVLSLELLVAAAEFKTEPVLGDAFPTIVMPEGLRSIVTSKLEALGVADYIVLHLEAATPFREWGAENALEFAQRFRAEHPDTAVLLTASPSYRMPEISLPLGVHRFIPGRDLLELAALIEGAKLVVTPETSITHFASAMHRPVVLLLPDRMRVPMEWLPIGVPAALLAPQRSGEPVSTIGVNDALAAVTGLWEGRQATTQTSFERPDHPMYQAGSAARPLSSFEVSS